MHNEALRTKMGQYEDVAELRYDESLRQDEE